MQKNYMGSYGSSFCRNILMPTLWFFFTLPTLYTSKKFWCPCPTFEPPFHPPRPKFPVYKEQLTNGWTLMHCTAIQMKQLDGVSPLAFIWDPNLTLTHVTSDLDLCDFWPLSQMSENIWWPHLKRLSSYAFFSRELFSSDRQMTERRRCLWAQHALAQVSSERFH